MNTETPTKRDLNCDMRRECQNPVTHIDEKGWIYCSFHGKQRQYDMHCRKLTDKELSQLKTGNPIPRY